MAIKISWNVDWLTFSGRIEKGLLEQVPIGVKDATYVARSVMEALQFERSGIELINPRKFYKYVFSETFSKAIIAVAEDPSEQGFLVQLSGKTLAELHPVAHLVDNARDNGFKVTRFDVAVDVVNGETSVMDIANEWLAVHGAQNNRSSKLISSPNGDSFYIGSRQSEKMLRIYDKAKEQKVDGDWIRFELEVKGLPADAWAESASRSPLAVIEVMLKMLDLPANRIYAELEALLNAGEILPPITRKQKGSREAWLRTQVLSAFDNISKEDPEAAARVLQDFIRVAVDRGIDTTAQLKLE